MITLWRFIRCESIATKKERIESHLHVQPGLGIRLASYSKEYMPHLLGLVDLEGCYV